MAVLVILDIEGATREQYDQVDELLGRVTAENAPPGLISHVAGPTDTGFLVADVWENPEIMQQSFEQVLGPALQQAGVPQVEPRVLPVYDHFNGGANDANVIVLIELDGMTTDDYDQLAASLPAHANPGAHPAVSHLAAVDGDGLVVVDIWESPEAFVSFAQSELAPRAGDSLSEMTPQLVPVHNYVPVKEPAIN
jgi:hypothetical protein